MYEHTFRLQLTEGLADLPAPVRAAWALTEIYGLSTREAAGILRCSATTVSRHAETARLHLMEEMDE